MKASERLKINAKTIFTFENNDSDIWEITHPTAVTIIKTHPTHPTCTAVRIMRPVVRNRGMDNDEGLK